MRLVRDRGQVATQEERDAVMDLVYQLEARNPTPDATNVKFIGEQRRSGTNAVKAGTKCVQVEEDSAQK